MGEPQYITIPVVDERLKIDKVEFVEVPDKGGFICTVVFSKDGFGTIEKQFTVEGEPEAAYGAYRFIRKYREAVRDFWFKELGPQYRRLRSQPATTIYDFGLSPAEKEALAELKKLAAEIDKTNFLASE